MDERGKFITFEGGEGCGKSTQIERLREYLESLGHKVLQVREPGGTILGEAIRHLLKDDIGDSPCDVSELLLFLAARAQLVRNVIEPALAAGTWVLSDRFSDSTFAYQGYGRGLPLDTLETCNRFACDDLSPDLTLWLVVSEEVSRARCRHREAAAGEAADRIEQAGNAFHHRVAEGFARLAEANPQRFVQIDANGTPDEVQELICKSLKRLS